MIHIKDLKLVGSKAELAYIPEGKVLINTINAFSYNNARKDALFEEALMKGDYLIPDGASIVKACRWVGSECQDGTCFQTSLPAPTSVLRNGGKTIPWSGSTA